MTTGSISDRRQFAQELLAAMAEQSDPERVEGLRRHCRPSPGVHSRQGRKRRPGASVSTPAATKATLPLRIGTIDTR